MHRQRAEIAERMRGRAPELRELILMRADGIRDSAGVADAEYRLRLRDAIDISLEYGLACIECGAEHCGPVPVELLAQARRAARSNVDLETVLRRYLAGYTLIADFLMQEVSCVLSGIPQQELYRLQKELAALFDTIIASVSVEYQREAKVVVAGGDRRLVCVERLLAGDLVDPASSVMTSTIGTSALLPAVRGRLPVYARPRGHSIGVSCSWKTPSSVSGHGLVVGVG